MIARLNHCNHNALNLNKAAKATGLWIFIFLMSGLELPALASYTANVKASLIAW